MHPLRAVKVAQGLLLPHGGQLRARQNAWSGMSRDAALSRDRREAELALAVSGDQVTARSSAAR